MTTNPPGELPLFTWQQHDLSTRDNGFGEKRSQCLRCGQYFRSQPKAASCPGVRVYNPYASASSFDGRPETLATVEELATEELMPADYQAMKGCLHTVNGHAFIALYERKNAIPRPPDAPPAPAEAIKASCVPSKSDEERKPRKARQRTPPDPLTDEQLAQARTKRIAQGIDLPTTFAVDERNYVLHLWFWREGFFDKQAGWWHYANRWSPEALLETVRQALPIGTRNIDRRFRVVATWRGEPIGEASYRQHGSRDDLSTVVLEEATGVLVGLIEEVLVRMRAEQQAEEDRLMEEERTVPCATCHRPVRASDGPARRILLQIDHGEPQTIEIFACEDHAERIQRATQVVNLRLFDPTVQPSAYNSSVALATWQLPVAPKPERENEV
jgi:hypothetical protein